MAEKVLLIINPVAGKNKTKTLLYKVVESICSGEKIVTLRFTKGRADAKNFAATAKKDGYDQIICLGGDGTLNEVVDGIMSSGENLPIGYIPAGSTNDFARSVGLKTDLMKAADRALNGEKTPFDVGCFNGKRFFTYVASFGAFTSTSYSAPQATKNALGHLAYILEGVKDFATLKPCNAKITCDGKVYEGSFIYGGVSNATSVGGVVKLDPKTVDMNDGFFELALVKNPKNLVEFNNILTAITTSDFSNGAIEFIKTKNVTFEFETNVPWSLDGEFAKGSKKVEIENLMSAITLMK